MKLMLSWHRINSLRVNNIRPSANESLAFILDDDNDDCCAITAVPSCEARRYGDLTAVRVPYLQQLPRDSECLVHSQIQIQKCRQRDGPRRCQGVATTAQTALQPRRPRSAEGGRKKGAAQVLVTLPRSEPTQVSRRASTGTRSLWECGHCCSRCQYGGSPQISASACRG